MGNGTINNRGTSWSTRGFFCVTVGSAFEVSDAQARTGMAFNSAAFGIKM